MSQGEASRRPKSGLMTVLLIFAVLVLVVVTAVVLQRRSPQQGQTQPLSSATTSPSFTPAMTPAPTGPISPSPTSTSPAPPTQPPTEPQPLGPPGSWTSTFDDEFDGNSLDLTKWRPNRSGGTVTDHPFNPSKEKAAFKPGNTTVQNGHLVFTLESDRTNMAGQTYALSSGTVSTQGTYSLLDGQYVEARIWIPEGDGLWPAFWSHTAHTWPPEMDGLEFFDTAKQIRPRANYHATNGDQSGPHVYGVRGTDYRNSWHTYGWLRDNGVMTPYLDGVPYPKAGAQGVDDRKYFIILNLSVYRGHHPQLGPGHTQMKVDWVRVWSPTDSPTP